MPSSATRQTTMAYRISRHLLTHTRAWWVCAVLVGLPHIATAQAATPASKLAWDQVGQSVATASGASYSVYIDTGTPIPLTGAVCVVGVPTTMATCTAPFPAMSPGAHTLTLTQVIAGAESPKSTPALAVVFVVVVTPTNIRVVP